MASRRIPAGQIIADALSKYDAMMGNSTMEVATQKLAELARSGDLPAIKLLNTYMAAAVKPEIAPIPPVPGFAQMDNSIVQANAIILQMADGQLSMEAGEKMLAAVSTGFNINQLEQIRGALAEMKQNWVTPEWME